MKQNKKTKKGFTLLELLVVIAIISILARILLPALEKARDNAREAMDMSNLHQLYLAVNMYCTDYHEWYPVATNMPSLDLEPGLVGINVVLKPYVPNPLVFKCPDDTGNPYSDDGESYFAKEGSSYEYNTFLCGQTESTITSRSTRMGGGVDYIPLLWDYENFFGNGRRNFVFLGGNVLDLQASEVDTEIIGGN